MCLLGVEAADFARRGDDCGDDLADTCAERVPVLYAPPCSENDRCDAERVSDERLLLLLLLLCRRLCDDAVNRLNGSTSASFLRIIRLRLRNASSRAEMSLSMRCKKELNDGGEVGDELRSNGRGDSIRLRFCFCSSVCAGVP